VSAELLILSDLHLGRPVRGRHGVALRAADFDALIGEGMQVCLNGDTAELQEPESRDIALAELDALHGLAGRRGATLLMHAGNHDPDVTDAHYGRFAGGVGLVTHGDVFHPSIAPWSPRAEQIRRAWAEEVAETPIPERNTLAGQFRAVKAASRAERRIVTRGLRMTSLLLQPTTVFSILWYWRQYPRLAAGFAHRHLPATRIVVAGHSHRPGIKRITRDLPNPLIVINTGAFSQPHAPHAVFLKDRTLTFHRLRRDTARPGRPFVRVPDPVGTVELQVPWHEPSIDGRGSPAFASFDGSVRPSASAMPAAASSNVETLAPVAMPDRSKA
jgi:hypothetical protein